MNPAHSWSLEGEDIIASTLLRKIKTGHYYDIGCAGPIEFSNTWRFYQQGWRGLAVDGRPLQEEWSACRPEDIFLRQLVGNGEEAMFTQFPDPYMNSCDPATIARYAERFPSEAITSSLSVTVPATRLWETVFPDIAPDLVSLDVEGHELKVLDGFDFTSKRPKLFIIELKGFNFLSPLRHPIVAFMCANDYTLISKTPLDGFFVDSTDEAFDWIPSEMLFKA